MYTHFPFTAIVTISSGSYGGDCRFSYKQQSNNTSFYVLQRVSTKNTVLLPVCKPMMVKTRVVLANSAHAPPIQLQMLRIGIFHQYLPLFVWGTQMAAQNCTFSLCSYIPIVDYSTVKLCHRDFVKNGLCRSQIPYVLILMGFGNC